MLCLSMYWVSLDFVASLSVSSPLDGNVNEQRDACFFIYCVKLNISLTKHWSLWVWHVCYLLYWHTAWQFLLAFQSRSSSTIAGYWQIVFQLLLSFSLGVNLLVASQTTGYDRFWIFGRLYMNLLPIRFLKCNTLIKLQKYRQWPSQIFNQ